MMPPARLLACALLLLAPASAAWPAGTELVGLSISGEQGNDDSGSVYDVGEGGPSHPTFVCPISDDGRFIAFISDATNLVPGDVNERIDIFVRDRLLGTTEIVNLTVTGGQFWGTHSFFLYDMSADGRFIAFAGSATASRARRKSSTSTASASRATAIPRPGPHSAPTAGS